MSALSRAPWLALLLVAAAAGAEPVVKSPNDSRDYRALELANGMRVVLVSDPETDKAAASLDVNVGSSSDPAGREGLAHFLEHMLFLGTERYPEPGEYQRFISAHGGSQNAYTAFDHTNYFFEVDKDSLEPALDRFAQFFVAPLFTARYVERERQVIDSEYSARRRAEGRRIFAAERAVMNPEHPLSRFAVGSSETLADRDGDPVRERLIEFYRRHYSAHLMTLTVVGREPLEVLERWVRERFEAVPRNDVEPLSITVPIYRPGTLPARLEVVPIKEQRSLTLTFPIPPVERYWREKPTALIAHLLGHEGPGSLLAALKRAGWADALHAGLGFDHPSAATFEVTIKLTPEGLARRDAVVAAVFDELRLIEREGVKRWIYEEQRRLAELRFRYRERPSAVALAREIAANLHRYPSAEVLRGPYAFERFDPPRVRAYLERLRPDNVLVTVVAPGLETDSEAPRYETAYRLRRAAPALLAEWSRGSPLAGLALPGPNPFVPARLDLFPGEEAGRPQRLVEEPGLTVWYRKDTSFRVPRASFYFSLRSPLANDSPRHAVLTRLLVDLVNDQLDAFVYPARLAGLDYSLYTHVRGLSVRIEGYDDRQAVLLERILAALRAPRLDPERFRILRADLIRRLANRRDDSPYQRAADELRNLLLVPSWSPEQRLAAAGRIGLADLERFVPELLGRLEVVALAHGNLTRARALALGARLRAALAAPARPVTVARGEVVRLTPGAGALRLIDSPQPDSAVIAYYQGRDRSEPERARMALLAQLLSAPFFEELRTERKLGYIVYATPMNLLEVPGIAFVVQSPSVASAALLGEIERFLAAFATRLEQMPASAIEEQRASLLGQILERDRRLAERSDRYWTEIDRALYTFDSRERLAAAVRAVGVEELRRGYRELLLEAPRRLVAAALGSRERAAGGRGPQGTRIADPVAFKAAHSRFPPIAADPAGGG